jgi:hypothetical protein
VHNEAASANASYYLVSTLAGKLASRLWQESPLESWHNRSNLMKTARANEPVIARLPDPTKIQPYRCPLSQVDNARDAHVRRKPSSPSCLTPGTFTYSLQICASTAHHAWWPLALHVGPFLKYICSDMVGLHKPQPTFMCFTSLALQLSCIPISLLLQSLSQMGNKPSTSVVNTCLTSAVGRRTSLLATKETALYQLVHVRPYNLDIPISPTAVTYPQSAEQVAAIVKCAVDNSLKVQPRSGGHSYANYGMHSLYYYSPNLRFAHVR